MGNAKVLSDHCKSEIIISYTLPNGEPFRLLPMSFFSLLALFCVKLANLTFSVTKCQNITVDIPVDIPIGEICHLLRPCRVAPACVPLGPCNLLPHARGPSGAYHALLGPRSCHYPCTTVTQCPPPPAPRVPCRHDVTCPPSPSNRTTSR